VSGGRRLLTALVGLLVVLFAAPGLAVADGPTIQVSLGDSADGVGSSAVKLVILLTLLSVAPAILLMMSCFVRFIVAFHFLRQALGTPQMPPNQVVIGLALFMTLFVMSPTIDQIHQRAWVPYENGELDTMEGIEAAAGPLREFMLSNTRQSDLKLFVQMGQIERPRTADDLPMRVIVPAFIVSELRAGFKIGFLLFLPFLVVDLVVASVLLSMGMMMLPPAMVSLPFKVLLFVLVDGWGLIASSLVAGFR
jgi:flagellar biosynthetic protein FliP